MFRFITIRMQLDKGKSNMKGGQLYMEKYEVPEMEIVEFDSEIAVTASVCGGQLDPETETIPIEGVGGG